MSIENWSPRAVAAKTESVGARSERGRPTATPSERLEWDEEVPGLALRIRANGTRSWVVVRKLEGRSVRTTLGPASALTRAQARALASAASGGGAAQRSPTLAAFGEDWLADCRGRWKPATFRSHARCVRSRIAPALGETPLARLTAADVVDWFAGMRAAAGTRNRALAVLSGMLAHAETLGLRRPGSNPCKGLRRRKSSFAARYLTAEEYARLGAALRAMEGRRPIEVALIRFLALTGARRGEALALEWDMIDGARAMPPDGKSGPRTIWLGAAARETLAGVPRTAAPLVFPGRRADRAPMLDATWRAVRAEIGLPALRIHDLRHGFASVAVTMGEPLRTVSELLGHADLATTEGYAHLAREPVAAAAKRVGAHLAKALGEPRRRANAAPPTPPEASPFAAHLKAFFRSHLSVAGYCYVHRLDERAFRAALAPAKAARRARARAAR